MEKLELKFSATLKNAQLGTIAAAQISRAVYDLLHTPFDTGSGPASASSKAMNEASHLPGKKEVQSSSAGGTGRSKLGTAPAKGVPVEASPMGLDQFAAEVEISVGEACTNSAKHALDGEKEDREIIVEFIVLHGDDLTHSLMAVPISLPDPPPVSCSGALVVTIKDQNAPFDFDAVPEPDFDAFPESGYGIFIMKEKMDQVSYRHEDGWNHLSLMKWI